MSALRKALELPNLAPTVKPRIAVDIIATGLRESQLYESFLGRGWGIKDVPGYYSILHREWNLDEKSLKFICLAHSKLLHLTSNPTIHGALPEFTVYFVNSLVIVQKEAIGADREFLLARGQPIAFADEVLSWIEGYEKTQSTKKTSGWPLRELKRRRTIQISGNDPASIGRFARRFRRMYFRPFDRKELLKRHDLETKKMNAKIKASQGIVPI